MAIWMLRLRWKLVVLTFFFMRLLATAMGQEAQKPFHVGYRTFDFTYAYPDGRQRTMTTAVWYPTRDAPKAYTYPERTQPAGSGDPWPLNTKLAVDARPAASEGPYPFVLFCHGAFGCAVNSAFFTEYLAAQGFVVAATDFEDTIPPDFTRQLAFSRLGEGNVAPPMLMLAAAGRFVKAFNEDREKCVWYAEMFRFQPARFVIDKVLEESRKDGSPLHGVIDERAVGIMGHSLGGLTSLGLIGPYEKTYDNRIKAALIFSAPVYPLEKGLSKIAIPLMTLYGDNDPSNLGGPDHPRRMLYEGIKAPRFCLVLKNANHFTFGNARCDDLSTLRESNPQARVIQDYGASFFRRYLKGDRSAEERLSKPDDGLVRYRQEMEAGKEQVWGEEPDEAGDGSPAGIRDELRKRLRDRGRNGGARGRRNGNGRQVDPKKTEGAATGYHPSGRFKVRAVKDLAYYDGPGADPKKHTLDLYLPEGLTGFPVLFFIHGGAWKIGDKDQAFGMYGTLGQAFAQEGIGTVTINYRLTPQVIHPEHIKDCARAFAWVCNHIEEYGGRKDRLFVSGQSAGGHLTALLLTNEKYLKEHGLSTGQIAGAIPISGVYRIFSNAFDAFGADRANWQDASPIDHVRANLPPFLIIVGDQDFPGADLMADGFARALKAKGNSVTLKTIPDRTHITIITKVGKDGDPTTAEMLRFIRDRADEF